MKSINTIVPSFVCLLATSGLAAQTLTLESGALDLRAAQLRSAPEAPLANTHKESVSFSAPVSASFVHAKREAFVATSQEYRVSISADELKRGVTLHTTGPAAVVTLSPLSAVKGAGLSPLDLSVETPGGTVLRGSDGMDQLVDQRALKATGMPFSNGMVGFRLNRALGGGEFILRSTEQAPATQYQLHVLDAQGSAELSLSAPAQTLVGQAFQAFGRFASNDTTVVKSATATLLSPSGERTAADVQIRGDRYSVTASASRAASFADGLWELHVTAVDANGLQRDVKTAFAAAFPVARLDGSVEQTAPLSFDFGLEAVSSGRFEVSAMLFGTGEAGLIPVASTATAAWLEEGASEITLSVDPELVKASGVSGPYVLRDIALKDQSRMAVLEHVGSSSTF